MTPKEIIKLMKDNSWQVKRIKGSHYIMEKNGDIEIVPYHSKDLKKGLELAILKRLGLK
ncbi:MAG: type II toxin-antitoxin system HicA family toxin [Ruminiclostridium sp.]|nr:type II toxin-antitoxin system HicA family toxin [Ruminiclostridium sp.]